MSVNAVGRTSRAGLNLILLIGTCVAGCDNSIISLCFVDNDDDVQISPSGRAVSFTNPKSYEAILNAPTGVRPALECVVDEFLLRFDSRPEAIVFTLDFEDRIVTRARLLAERGFEWFPDDTEMSEDEFLRYGTALNEVRQILDGLPDPPALAFTARFRRLERGTGTSSVKGCSWLCPEYLRGYVFLPTKEQLVAGRFLHEFGHFWGGGLAGPPALKAQLDRYRGHWGFSSVGGLLGGWEPGSLAPQGEGLFHADVAPAGRGVNRFAYAPLELYLMGLAGPDEVPPIQVAVGVERFGETEEGLDVFRAERLETVTIAEIIEGNGERVPSFADAPKEFHVALVVLTDHRLSDSEWDFYERAMDFLEGAEDERLLDVFLREQYPGQHEVWETFSGLSESPYLNFAGATGGRGRLRFDATGE